MGLVVLLAAHEIVGLLRVRLLVVTLRAADDAVSSVGEGFLHLVHGGLLGVRSDLLLSLCSGVESELICYGWVG